MPTQVVNIRGYKGTNGVYIGRAGKGENGYFGNPHSIGYCSVCKYQHNREGCIEAFEVDFYKRLNRDAGFKQLVLGLKGKDLIYFCSPVACHEDVYKEYLDEIK